MSELAVPVLVICAIVFLYLMCLSFSAPKAEKEQKQAREASRRQTKCTYQGKISRGAFQTAAAKACENVKDLTKYRISGTVVHGFSDRKKDNTSWAFDLDFNDHGRITGRYWMYSENPHSKLPEWIGSLIQEALEAECKADDVIFECKPVDKPIEDYPQSAPGSVIPVLAAIALLALVVILSRML